MTMVGNHGATAPALVSVLLALLAASGCGKDSPTSPPTAPSAASVEFERWHRLVPGSDYAPVGSALGSVVNRGGGFALDVRFYSHGAYNYGSSWIVSAPTVPPHLAPGERGWITTPVHWDGTQWTYPPVDSIRWVVGDAPPQPAPARVLKP
jgi:hypothetical protein